MSIATHKPKDSGYAESKPSEAPVRDQPDPDAAGGQRAQVAAHKLPDEEEPSPDEDTPPGEHKREPIKDPDPADTKLHVQHGHR
jgi:hypothetical protein